MTHKARVTSPWGKIPDVFDVVGLKGIAALSKKDCVIDEKDEGNSVLLTVDLCGSVRKIRIAKEFPTVGLVVPDIRSTYPEELKDILKRKDLTTDD